MNISAADIIAAHENTKKYGEPNKSKISLFSKAIEFLNKI